MLEFDLCRHALWRSSVLACLVARLVCELIVVGFRAIHWLFCRPFGHLVAFPPPIKYKVAYAHSSVWERAQLCLCLRACHVLCVCVRMCSGVFIHLSLCMHVFMCAVVHGSVRLYVHVCVGP